MVLVDAVLTFEGEPFRQSPLAGGQFEDRFGATADWGCLRCATGGSLK